MIIILVIINLIWSNKNIVRMDSLKGHICSAHKAWLTSNPRANLRAWEESLEVGQYLLSSGELSTAQNALFNALEFAKIYFSTSLKVIDKPKIEMFSETVSKLAYCFSLKGDTSKRNQIIVYGIDRLQQFMTFGADRITVLKACHLLMEAQQIEKTKHEFSATSANHICISSNRTIH